jgi:molybdate/tungstate transport system permease protein
VVWSRALSEFGAVVIVAYHPRVASTLVYERFTGYGIDAALPQRPRSCSWRWFP